MEDFLLSIIPTNVITFFVVCILAYMIFWVYSYRKILLVIGLVGVLGYVVFLWHSKKELTQQVTQSQVYDGFSRNSLGYSLNNPGNIRITSSFLPGEIRSSNSSFKEFSTMKHGFRAMSALLHNYIKNGYNTLNKIINRYAPKGDGNNNPDHYASIVAKNANIKVNQVLSDQDFKNGNMMNIIYFMTRVEQGYAPNIKDLSDEFDMYMNEK